MRRRAQSILRELEEYRRNGVRVSLEGKEYRLRTIAGIVAERGCYMRDYDFTSEGKVRSLEFRKIRQSPRIFPEAHGLSAGLPEKDQ